jgi:hypothetical protein
MRALPSSPVEWFLLMFHGITSISFAFVQICLSSFSPILRFHLPFLSPQLLTLSLTHSRTVFKISSSTSSIWNQEKEMEHAKFLLFSIFITVCMQSMHCPDEINTGRPWILIITHKLLLFCFATSYIVSLLSIKTWRTLRITFIDRKMRSKKKSRNMISQKDWKNLYS